MEDFVEMFLEYTDGLPSPAIYRKWTAIATIAAAVERRVYIKLSGGPVYPNFYIMLVGPPATGKSISIEQSRDLVRATRRLYLAPKAVTKAALLDSIARSKRVFILDGGKTTLEYNSLYAASPEFGVLIPEHDYKFLNVLNDIFDNPPDFDDETRHSTSVHIINPQLNMLVGTQPGYLASLLPEEAWTVGFMSRMIMVYSSVATKADVFNAVQFDSPIRSRLVQRMIALTGTAERIGMHGPALIEPEAVEMIRAWHNAGLPPVPNHSKLVHYQGRRLINSIKLSITAAISRSGDKIITPEDFIRARDWLLEVEQLMPDVFRDMVQKSDAQVIEGLHYFMWPLYARDRKPLHEQTVIRYLSTQVPSEKVLRILEIAVRSNIIATAGDKFYIPRPRTDFGVE